MAELVSLDEISTAAGRLSGVAVRTPLIPVAVAAVPFRDAAELGIASGTAAPVVAVLSGGNIDPTLLEDILKAESYTG